MNPQASTPPPSDGWHLCMKPGPCPCLDPCSWGQAPTGRSSREPGQPAPEKPPKFPLPPMANRPPIRRKPTRLVRAEVPKP